MECFQGPDIGPSALQTPKEEGTLAISVLQMKKLSLREITASYLSLRDS